MCGVEEILRAGLGRIAETQVGLGDGVQQQQDPALNDQGHGQRRLIQHLHLLPSSSRPLSSPLPSECLAAVQVKAQPGHPQQRRCQTGQEEPHGVAFPSVFFTLVSIFFTPTRCFCPHLSSTQHYPQRESHSYEQQSQGVAANESKV